MAQADLAKEKTKKGILSAFTFVPNAVFSFFRHPLTILMNSRYESDGDLKTSADVCNQMFT